MTHQTSLKEGIVVGQETVRHVLHILDPMGMSVRGARRLRSSPGLTGADI